MPSITFLGTAGDEYTVGKQLRASGGIVIKTSGYQFHVDPGPGTLVRAKQTGINLRENTALLISHAHINHCNDANAVLAAMSRNGFDINGVLIANMTFVNGDDESRLAPIITDFHRNCVERIIVAKPGHRIGIENMEIQALKAFHKDPHALGFKFITPQFTLVYTGDTKYNKELIDQYKKADIIVFNMVYPSEGKEKNSDNLCFDDVVKILDKIKPKLAVITHFGKKMLEADPLNEARKLQKLTGIQVLAALDGMSINPTTYSADAKQKTLGLFKGQEVKVENSGSSFSSSEENEINESDNSPSKEDESFDETQDAELEISEAPVEESVDEPMSEEDGDSSESEVSSYEESDEDDEEDQHHETQSKLM